jgi:D-xylose transport system permease protein
VGLVGAIAAVLITRQGWPAPLAMLAAAAAALALWRGMGRLITSQRVPAFIVTLGGLLVFKGLFWLVIRSTTVPVAPGGAPNVLSLLTSSYLPPAWGWTLGILLGALLVAKGRDFLKSFLLAQLALLFVAVTNGFRGVPVPAVLLAAAFGLAALVSERTRFGRALYAIGGNEEAARLAGIDVPGTVVRAFVVMGAAVAVTGFLQTAYAGAATTTVGDLMELDAVAACVIGGVSLFGGRGDARGVLFGALIMATLLNGMTLLAVPPELKFIVRGLVLTAAVWLDSRFAR